MMKRLMVGFGSLLVLVLALGVIGSDPAPVVASSVTPFTVNMAPFVRKAAPTNTEPGAKRACIPCCGICECEPASLPDGVCSWWMDGPPYFQCVANTGGVVLPTVNGLMVPADYLTAEGQVDTAKLRTTVPEGVSFTMPTGPVEWLTSAELHARRQIQEGRLKSITNTGLIVDNVRIR